MGRSNSNFFLHLLGEFVPSGGWFQRNHKKLVKSLVNTSLTQEEVPVKIRKQKFINWQSRKVEIIYHWNGASRAEDSQQV